MKGEALTYERIDETGDGFEYSAMRLTAADYKVRFLLLSEL